MHLIHPPTTLFSFFLSFLPPLCAFVSFSCVRACVRACVCLLSELSELCQQLRLLEDPVSQDVDALIAAASVEPSPRAVRDFKSKLDAVRLAYEPLMEQMLEVAKSDAHTFPQFAATDATKAEIHANILYSWARTYVPQDADSPATMDKTAKLNMMPYIVAMAYAVRVKLDVHYVESRGMIEAERHEYLKRSSNVVEQFMATLELAMRAMLHDSGLLEVALDYHLALTTCVTLKAAMRASVQMILGSHDVPRTTVLWDDGLAEIR